VATWLSITVGNIAAMAVFSRVSVHCLLLNSLTEMTISIVTIDCKRLCVFLCF